MPEIPLNPEQQKFERDIDSSPTINILKETITVLECGQKDIKKTLFEHEENEKEFESYVKDEFKKGSDKFIKLEGRIDGLEGEMKTGFDNMLSAINNKEMEKLREEVRDKRSSAKESKKFWLGVGQTVLAATIIALILFGLSKIGITAP